MNSSSVPVWIKLFLALGILTSVFFFFTPFLLGAVVVKELKRNDECRSGMRQDCEPSFVWDWFMTDNGSSPERGDAQFYWDDLTAIGTTSTDTPSTDRSIRSSATAPRILSVSPKGMTYVNGVYTAQVGKAVTMEVQTLDATSVEVYAMGSSPTAAPTKLGVLVFGESEGEAQNFRGSITLTKTGVGSLEVRALNKKGETASLFLVVAAK